MSRPSAPAILMDSARAVWPEASSIDLVRSATPRGGDVHDYVVLPALRSPTWLLPLDTPSAAAALRSGAAPAAREAGIRLLMWAHRSGLTRRLPVARVRVVDHDRASLLGRLSETVGGEVSVAIRLGSWSYARSLGVRVFGANGETKAFAKVGLDPTGRAAVRQEAEALLRAAALDVPGIVRPRVLDHGEWHGLEVLVMTPLIPPGDRRRRGRVPLEAMHRLAQAGDARRSELAASGWSASVRKRLAEVDDADLRARLESAFRRLEHTGGAARLQLGPWHGDWTQWNMAWDGDRVMLWDWEHFAEDVPVGFDHVHYLAQQLRVTRGTDRAAEQAWRESAAELLGGAVGLREDQQELVIVAYLLEANLRFVLDRQATPDRGRSRQGWGLEMLEREAGAL